MMFLFKHMMFKNIFDISVMEVGIEGERQSLRGGVMLSPSKHGGRGSARVLRRAQSDRLFRHCI